MTHPSQQCVYLIVKCSAFFPPFKNNSDKLGLQVFVDVTDDFFEILDF